MPIYLRNIPDIERRLDLQRVVIYPIKSRHAHAVRILDKASKMSAKEIKRWLDARKK